MNVHSVLADSLQNSPSKPMQPIRLKLFVVPAKKVK